jgi:hypothetical protein
VVENRVGMVLIDTRTCRRDPVRVAQIGQLGALD